MSLVANQDYLFFHKVDVSKQSLTAAVSRGLAVLTPNLIAAIPIESYGSLGVASVFTKYNLGGGNPVAMVEALVADPATDLAALEAALTSVLSRDKTRWVFPLAELETFTVKTGFFGMISLKMPGESVRRMIIRDKGGKVAAAAFYASRLGA